jgi:ribosomal protein S6--L-glutamate ligase
MNIVVLSRNPQLYSTNSIVKAGRGRNHYVRVMDHMHCDLIVEDSQLEIYYNKQKLTGVDAIIPRIGNSATSYGSAVIRQFEAKGVYSVLGSDPLLRSRDKISCLQILARHGIKVPKTAISNNSYSAGFLLDTVGSSPHVLKLASGTHGMGVILSPDKQNAESILEAFSNKNQRILIQKFIAEARGADIRVFIVGGEIVGVMKRQAKPGEFRSNLHRGGHSFVVKLSDKEKEVALKACELMGLNVAGVDMLQTHEGPMVLEVNASPGLEGIESTTKVDIASKIIEFVERNANH